jgi:hypothetical protein
MTPMQLADALARGEIQRGEQWGHAMAHVLMTDSTARTDQPYSSAGHNALGRLAASRRRCTRGHEAVVSPPQDGIS